MGIEIIGKLTQKNNGDFKLVDLENVDYDGTGKSAKQELEKKIEEAKNSSTPYDDSAIKADIQTLKTNEVNLVEDETSMEGIKDNEYPTLTTTDKTLIGSINEVNAQCKDVANKINSGNIGNNIEPLDDDLPNVYITGTLPTSKAEGDLPITIHYISKTLDFKNYGTLKVQGASSASYPKKNFTLKLYKDEQHTSKDKKAFKQWGKLNKFVLKAHWMDCSHVRNVGTAKIWGKIAKSRSDYNTLPNEFKNSPNAGATDGFTVRVFANGIYQGLYEWIVPKDKLFGQDGDNPNHSILNSELNNNVTCAFNTTTPNVTTSTWSEELQDTLSPNIATSFSNLIKFVAGSTDADFIANAENYFDVQSVIDYDIFARIFCIVDNLCRNQIFFTYDGTKWYEGVWDLDAVLGLPPTTRGFYAYNTEFQNGYVAYADYKVTNMLYQRVETLFMDRFKTRYQELRADILSIEGILHVYEKLTNVIKTYDGLLEEDYASTTGEGKFTGIPYHDVNNIQQIRTFIAKRLPYMDEVINSMHIAVPCTNITLNNTTLSFTNTTPQTLTTTLTPTDTTDKVIWSVSPAGIATVNNGVVKPIKNGECVVTATCGEKSATCNVSISGLSETTNYVTDGLYADYDLRQLQPDATTIEDLSGNNNTFNIDAGTIQKDDKGGLISTTELQISNNSFNPQTANVTIEYTIKYTGVSDCTSAQSYPNRTCGIDGHNGEGYYMWLGGASYNIFKNSKEIAKDVALTNKLVNKQYYHIVVIYTETNASLYINNELIQTFTHTISGIPRSRAYYISNTGGGGCSAQTLYSTRFYNKALTTEEISQNYQYEFNKLGIETN